MNHIARAVCLEYELQQSSKLNVKIKITNPGGTPVHTISCHEFVLSRVESKFKYLLESVSSSSKGNYYMAVEDLTTFGVKFCLDVLYYGFIKFPPAHLVTPILLALEHFKVTVDGERATNLLIYSGHYNIATILSELPSSANITCKIESDLLASQKAIDNFKQFPVKQVKTVVKCVCGYELTRHDLWEAHMKTCSKLQFTAPEFDCRNSCGQKFTSYQKRTHHEHHSCPKQAFIKLPSTAPGQSEAVDTPIDKGMIKNSPRLPKFTFAKPFSLSSKSATKKTVPKLSNNQAKETRKRKIIAPKPSVSESDSILEEVIGYPKGSSEKSAADHDGQTCARNENMKMMITELVDILVKGSK